MSIRRFASLGASLALLTLSACARDIAGPTLRSSDAPSARLVTGSWTQRLSIPEPRNGRAGAVVNGRLYGFGGALSSDCTYTRSGYAFDPATNTWSTTSLMTVSRSEAAGVALNGNIHVLGGNPTCGAQTGAHEVYSPETNTWTTKPSMTPRYSARAAAVNGKIYVIGGFINGAGLSLVEEFDPTSGQWTTKAPMPTPRGGGAVAVLNDEIYVMGGCCGGPVTDNAFEIYSPATNTWTRKSPLPFNQSTAVAAGMNGQVYIFGAGNSGEMVKRYDPATDTWDTDAPMPVAVVWHFGGVIGNSFYMASGHNIGVLQHRTWEFAFNFTDVTPPSVTVPADFFVDAVDAAGATATFAATTTDNVGVVSEHCSPASGSVFPIGSTTVTCSASDAAGNTGAGTFTVTVRDVTPPVISDMPDLTANATGPLGAAVSYTVNASDNVEVAAVTCTPASGSTFALGAIVVECTATDAAGNVATESFTVTVSDVTGPTFGALPDITVNADSPTGSIVPFNPLPVDNVGVVSQSCTPATGTVFPVGSTVVSCSAADAAGNTAQASFTVTVVGPAAQMAVFDAVVVDLNIHEGTETSLRAKLEAARTSLGSGDVTTACNQLEAMINQINAQVGKKLSGYEAGVLNEEIARIKRATGC